jgi:GGDEF-like domain
VAQKDQNAKQDVYEFEFAGNGSCSTEGPSFSAALGGCQDLISSGESSDHVYLDDASPSGNDVFFATRQRLLPSDDDEHFDIYDARVGAALQYGLAALRHGTDDPPPVPPVLLAQARLAARNGVNLDTVLRRYFSGFALFGDFVIGEAKESPLPKGVSVQELLAKEAAHFDRLIEAVSQEHTKERERRFRSPRQRQAERVRRLLAGESGEAEKLDYNLDAWHIAAIGKGTDAEAALRCLAGILDRRLLLTSPGGGTVWAWFGGDAKIPTEAILERAKGRWPEKTPLALGEPAQGIEGWRFSHRQAKAALSITQRQGQGIVPYE